jgi:putative glutamine amidotransferase
MYSVAADYTTAIERAGGMPVILPLHMENIEGVLDALHGVVFTGGGDIEPSLFNQEKHETTDYIDEERDSFEIALMKAAFGRDLPILAICRGIQVMNVERGGTLIQDIPSQTDSTMEHAQRSVGADEHDPFQTAVVQGGDHPLAVALGEGDVPINSFHHQALGEVPESLTVVATSEDGIIEAVYAPDSTYAVGTQWHPERLAAQHAEHQALFDNLVCAAETYAESNH